LGSVTALPQRGHATECGIGAMPPMLSFFSTRTAL
jgi:hypothetical protein